MTTLERDVEAWSSAAPQLNRGETCATHMTVASLRQGLSPRATLDNGHVATLMELDGLWPPLLVHRETSYVIDGAHRLTAAKKLGMLRVAVTIFDGTLEEAGILAIRANIEHGLPLALEDRKRAARHLLESHQFWSDRHIASTCGVAAKTVARLRNEVPDRASTDGVVRAGCRLGRDGRVRSSSPGSLSKTIADAVKDNSGASLRTIARLTGAAPETVRRVRNELAASTLALEAGQADPHHTWLGDAAFSGSEPGTAFATWFDRYAVDGTACEPHANEVPLSRVYEVIDETRRRIAFWEEFADRLSRRTRPSGRR